MGKAYSLQTRWSAVKARTEKGLQGGTTHLAGAITESVGQGPALPGVDIRHPSRSSVYRFHRSYNLKYSLAQESRPGRTGNWTSADKVKFRGWAVAQGKFTLDQAHEAVYYLIGKRVHRSRISKVLAKVGLTRKKQTLIDPRRCEDEVQAHYAMLRKDGITARQIVSIDEVGFRGGELVLKHGWSDKGERFIDFDTPENAGPRHEGIVAISSSGLVAVQIYSEGTVQWPNVCDFAINELFPTMNTWPVASLVSLDHYCFVYVFSCGCIQR
ncbi:hypothetical protein T484DRAFT_1756126 [Baffinella frigidus]|nr:hypothetical protein T484DRAFT_1756126 [Cryptophyta sp. CCMP2293]